MEYALTAFIAFLTSCLATPLVRRLASVSGAVDRPDGVRKAHGRTVSLLGGLAVLVGVTAGIAVALAAGGLPGPHIKAKYLIGISLAAAALIFGGALDDRLNLKPKHQILFPLLAAAIVIVSGIGVAYITNPFGGQISLDSVKFTAVWWEGIPYRVTLFADIFTFCWLMGMSYTTKFLDGLDGLVAGVTVIGALVIAGVCFMQDVAQPDTALLSLAVAGAFLGLLVFNFPPASIFLGEGGSVLAGFLLGTLAIISGGKIATALLILGLPIFDAALVIVRRVASGKSPVAGDRSHLHFRLLELGLTGRQTVLFYYFVAAWAGTATLVLRGSAKVVALGALFSLLLAVLSFQHAVRGKRT
jgi:UDP-GlcNAc:undecaprenyl-phosphate GlcNAc-1-phosphate transferase